LERQIDDRDRRLDERAGLAVVDRLLGGGQQIGRRGIGRPGISGREDPGGVAAVGLGLVLGGAAGVAGAAIAVRPAAVWLGAAPRVPLERMAGARGAG